MKNERRFIIVQVLKEEVRLNIRNAAIKAFKAEGYQKASMRAIAEDAGMSPGNLYRYYKNKEALFGALVQPMINFFQVKQQEEFEMTLEMVDVNLLEHSVFIEQLMEARLDFRDELFILFLRADGSPYVGAKEVYRAFIEEQSTKFYKRFFGNEIILKGNMLIKATASSIVEGFCTILEHSESDREFYINMLEYAEMMVKPGIRNLIALRDNQTKFRRISDEEIMGHFNSRHHHRGHCGAESN